MSWFSVDFVLNFLFIAKQNWVLRKLKCVVMELFLPVHNIAQNR